MSDSDSDHYPPELWAYFRAGAAEMAEMAETAVAPTVVSCSEMDGEVQQDATVSRICPGITF